MSVMRKIKKPWTERNKQWESGEKLTVVVVKKEEEEEMLA